MTKELTHRGEELKNLGWSQENVFRYVELWEYRQRWGAINLEREDRQFLRKAEAALPEISKTKASIKKALNEKSYYRWLSFYLNEMNKTENEFENSDGFRGLWSILLEEELRVLDYYEPVLGLPDTLKAKLLKPIREEIVKNFEGLFQSEIKYQDFDFNNALKAINEDYSKSWKPLRDHVSLNGKSYPLINDQKVEDFRKEVRASLLPAIKNNFPSLADSDKPAPPEDWSPKSYS